MKSIIKKIEEELAHSYIELEPDNILENFYKLRLIEVLSEDKITDFVKISIVVELDNKLFKINLNKKVIIDKDKESAYILIKKEEFNNIDTDNEECMYKDYSNHTLNYYSTIIFNNINNTNNNIRICTDKEVESLTNFVSDDNIFKADTDILDIYFKKSTNHNFSIYINKIEYIFKHKNEKYISYYINKDEIDKTPMDFIKSVKSLII
jgi:hypothetical protein